MFKKTQIAVFVALVIPGVALADIPGVALADISYDNVGVNADESKAILAFTWDATRSGGNISETKQNGWENTSETLQTAGGSAASIVIQEGVKNTAKVAQDETSSGSAILQQGAGNDATAVLAFADGSVSPLFKMAMVRMQLPG